MFSASLSFALRRATDSLSARVQQTTRPGGRAGNYGKKSFRDAATFTEMKKQSSIVSWELLVLCVGVFMFCCFEKQTNTLLHPHVLLCLFFFVSTVVSAQFKTVQLIQSPENAASDKCTSHHKLVNVHATNEKQKILLL